MSANVRRTNQPRSATGEHQDDLPGLPPKGWGVGNAPSPSSWLGGGYLSVCTPFEFSIPGGLKKISRDPRIAELETMGLRRVFIDLAEKIGFDHFMTVWRAFDTDPAFIEQGPSGLRVVMRRYSAWERYQRNRYMEALFKAGLSDDQVLERLQDQLRENLTKRHVERIREKV